MFQTFVIFLLCVPEVFFRFFNFIPDILIFNGIKGVALMDIIPLRNIDLQHRSVGKQGNAGAVLRHRRAAALHLADDGAAGDHVRQHLGGFRLVLVLPPKEVASRRGCCQNSHDDDSFNQSFAILFLFSLRLGRYIRKPGAASRSRFRRNALRRGLLSRFILCFWFLIEYFCHG